MSIVQRSMTLFVFYFILLWFCNNFILLIEIGSEKKKSNLFW
jgi:hypothetical protein